MSRSSALLKNTAILSLGTVVPKLVNIVTLPVLTGFLSKADYGTYDLVVSMVTLLLPVATLQLQAAAFRFLIDARNDDEKKKAICTNILVVSITLSLVILAALFFLMPDVDVVGRLLICAYYLLDILVATLRQIARGLSKNGIYSVSVIVNSLSEGLAVIGFVMLLGFGLNGALLASLLGQAASLVLLIAGVRIFSLLDLRSLSLRTTGKLLAYSWPLIPNSLSSWAISMSDRLILAVMIGIESSAIYAAAMKIPNMLGVFNTAFGLAWQENASLSRNDEDKNEYYSSMFDAMFCLLAGGLALLIATSPLLFDLLIKGGYEESYVQMNILFLGSLASCVSTFLGGIYIAHMRTKEIGATTVAVAVVNIVAEVILVPILGVYAASLSYTLSFVALSLCRGLRLRKFQPITFKVGKLFVVSAMLVVMVLVGSVREPARMGINVILGLALFVVLNKKILGSLLSKVLKR